MAITITWYWLTIIHLAETTSLTFMVLWNINVLKQSYICHGSPEHLRCWCKHRHSAFVQSELNNSEEQTVTSFYLCVYLWRFPRSYTFRLCLFLSSILWSTVKMLPPIRVSIHDSRVLRCRQIAIVWLTVDHRTAQWDKCDTPKYPRGQNNEMTAVFFNIKLLFLSAGIDTSEWHICC